jgi:hypothetical protein
VLSPSVSPQLESCVSASSEAVSLSVAAAVVVFLCFVPSRAVALSVCRSCCHVFVVRLPQSPSVLLRLWSEFSASSYAVYSSVCRSCSQNFLLRLTQSTAVFAAAVVGIFCFVFRSPPQCCCGGGRNFLLRLTQSSSALLQVCRGLLLRRTQFSSVLL